MLRLPITAASFALLTLVGCCHQATQGETNTVQLENTQWDLISLNGNDVSEVNAKLRFDNEGRISGFTGCNNFGGRYQASATTLSFSQVFSTRRACLIGTEVERDLLGILSGSGEYAAKKDRLSISNADQTVTATFRSNLK